MATISLQNSGKIAPLWFRKIKKIWANTETLIIALLLIYGHGEGSLWMLLVKMGSHVLLENIETVLAEDVTEKINEKTEIK
jgi:hypothetical protein